MGKILRALRGIAGRPHRRADDHAVPAGRQEASFIKKESIDEQALAQKLAAEGFSHTYVWQDEAGAHYPDHTHAVETAHVILAGEMTLTMSGKSRTYRAGERCDVPAGAVHSAEMGPRGCRYFIGEL